MYVTYLVTQLQLQKDTIVQGTSILLTSSICTYLILVVQGMEQTDLTIHICLSCKMNLLAIAISLVVKADAFSPPLHACGKLRSSILLLASIDKDACDDKIFEGLNITCGPGFNELKALMDPAVRTTLMLSPPNYPLVIHSKPIQSY